MTAIPTKRWGGKNRFAAPAQTMPPWRMRATSLAVGVLLLAGTVSSAFADQAISFNNNNLGSPRLVTFSSEYGALGGTGVRNGVADGASFVAQLFQVVGPSLSAIGAPANFRAATTAFPGTWSGGTRTALGVPPGTEIQLVVRAWDSAFPTYEEARAAGKLTGQSAVFTFQDALSSPPAPSDILMVNFQGFVVGVPEPRSLLLGALGCTTLLWLARKR